MGALSLKRNKWGFKLDTGPEEFITAYVWNYEQELMDGQCEGERAWTGLCLRCYVYIELMIMSEAVVVTHDFTV